MKIRVFNRTFRNEAIDDLEYDEVNITAPQLLAKLWNMPEADHSKMFARENLQACMVKSTAGEYIDKQAGNPKEGPVEIYFKKIKHDNARKYLGLTLKGHKEGFGIIWTEATIDKSVFLKHRKDYKGTMIEQLIVSMSREAMKSQVRETLKIKAKQQEAEDETDLRPQVPTSPVIIEPLKEDKANKKDEEKNKSTWYGRLFKSPITHGLIVGGLTAAGLLLARVGTMMLIGVSVAAAAVTWGLESLYSLRQRKIEDGYEEYDKMSPSKFKKLEPEVKKALHTGLESKAWGPWGKSLFDTSAWKNYKAYGAGLKASIDPDDDLAAKIRLKAKLT